MDKSCCIRCYKRACWALFNCSQKIEKYHHWITETSKDQLRQEERDKVPSALRCKTCHGRKSAITLDNYCYFVNKYSKKDLPEVSDSDSSE